MGGVRREDIDLPMIVIELARVAKARVRALPSKNGLLQIGQTSAGFKDFLGIRSSSGVEEQSAINGPGEKGQKLLGGKIASSWCS